MLQRRRRRLAGFGTSSAPTWSESGSLTGVTLGTVSLEATFNTVYIDVPFTLDGGSLVSVTATLRPLHRLGLIRPFLPLWRASGDTSYVGAVTDLEAGHQYEVRIVATDGVGGTQVVIENVTTRAENIPVASSLTPNRFVTAAGSDSANGTAEGTAWRHFTKAWDTATSGQVVRFGPGVFEDTSPYTSTNAQSGRTGPITLMAQYPAVNDDGELINEGLRSVIVPGGAYRTEPGTGEWTRVTLTGPGANGATAGAKYKVWRYTGNTDTGVRHLWWSDEQLSPLQRVAHWKYDATHLNTPEKWAELMFAGLSCHYGFWVDATAGATAGHVYLRLPSGANPNSLYIWMMNAGCPAMFRSSADNARVSGLWFRGWHIAATLQDTTGGGVDGFVFDHNYVEGMQTGVYLHGDSGATRGVNATIQHNRFEDTNLRAEWGAPATDNEIITWQGIKSAVLNANGTNFAVTKLFNNAEGRAVGGRNSSRLVVIRRNVIRGVFNGVYSGDQATTRYAGQNWDIAHNTITLCADDAFEPEGVAMNWMIRDNRVEHALVFLSTGPSNYGPIYCIRNTVWRWGSNGVGLVAPGGEVAGQSPPSANAFKFSGSANPAPKIFVYHNTFWSDADDANGGEEVASPGSNEDIFEFQGNIIRAGRYAFYQADATSWQNENGNLWATSDGTRGLRVGSTIYQDDDIAAYRTATSQGANSQILTAPALDAFLVSPADGDLRLAIPAVIPKVQGVSELIARPQAGAEVIVRNLYE